MAGEANDATAAADEEEGEEGEGKVTPGCR